MAHCGPPYETHRTATQINPSPGPATAERGKGGRRKNTGFILLSTHLRDYWPGPSLHIMVNYKVAWILREEEERKKFVFRLYLFPTFIFILVENYVLANEF